MTPRAAAERCHRCLQPVPLNARRCPNCGDILKVSSRRLTLYLAAAGIIGILGIVGLSLTLKPNTVDTENSQGAGQQAPPPKPARKPPLD